MKTSLLKKLFAIIIASVTIIITAKAQIVYADVNPDTTFDCGVSPCTSIYDLDLNKDGIVDYEFQISKKVVKLRVSCNVTKTNYYIFIVPLNNNGVLNDSTYPSFYPSALSVNAVVSPYSAKWITTSSQTVLTSTWICSGFWHPAVVNTHKGFWANQKDKYLGLKFHAGSNIFFGWVRLSVIDIPYLTIQDYAYNSVNNHPILTGQKTVFNWVGVAEVIPSPLKYCRGEIINVKYSKHGAFKATNIFTAQLSDSTGSFAHPVAIGSIQSNNAGTIKAIIPASLTPSLRYRIRVVSSNPSADSVYDNGTDIVIGAHIRALGSTTMCQFGHNDNLSLEVYFVSQNNTFQWLKNRKEIEGETNEFLSVFYLDSTASYNCVVTDVCGADTSNTIVVTVLPIPTPPVITASGPTTFCKGGNVTLHFDSVKGLSYEWWWYPTAEPIPWATGSSYIADTSSEYFVQATNKHGCNSYSNFVDVNVPDTPEAYIGIPNGDTSLCVGDSVEVDIVITKGYGDGSVHFQHQWKKNGKNVTSATLKYYYAKTAGTYTCKVTNMCGSTITKGVSLTTKQCKGLFNNDVTSDEKIISPVPQLKVYPNPFSNSTIISFSLPQSQKVSLSIYDMTGRLIKTIASAEMQAGNHQLTWNAKDEKGNAVSAGIYFLKMHAGNRTETKKLLIIN